MPTRVTNTGGEQTVVASEGYEENCAFDTKIQCVWKKRSKEDQQSGSTVTKIPPAIVALEGRGGNTPSDAQKGGSLSKSPNLSEGTRIHEWVRKRVSDNHASPPDQHASRQGRLLPSASYAKENAVQAKHAQRIVI